MYSFSPRILLYLIHEIFLERTYTFTTNNPTPTIIDCGSNIGISILFFKKLVPGARIVGFEPDPTTFKLLVRNLRENGFCDVSLNNAAVSDRRGDIAFYSDAETAGSLVMSTVEDRVAGALCETVPAVTLSTYVQGPVDLIKMDVEGAELDVLRELAASTTLGSVKAIIMEYHHHIRRHDDRLSHLLKVLEDNSFGYVVDAAPIRHSTFQDIQLRIYNKKVAGSSETVYCG